MPPFRPAWWLPGPHTATLWGKFGRRDPAPRVRWERVDTPDGDFLELAHLDMSPAIASGQGGGDDDGASGAVATRAPVADAADAPRLLILHGLEGGVGSHYVRGFMGEAARRGWNATVLLFRTCGPTPNTLVRSYHSGETTDARFIIERFASRYPTTPLGLVGVSLGGNVLCKLLGETGDALPAVVCGAAAISVPFDLARASRHIGRGFGRIYERAFLRSLIPKALRKIARHPELAALRSVQSAATLWEFDDRFTAPLHGFASAADYYARASSLQYLSGIRRPTLLISAVDDPFLPADVLQEVEAVARGNRVLELEFTPQGGHVGFTGGVAPWRPFYYGEWRAAEFLAARFAEATPGIHSSSMNHHVHPAPSRAPATAAGTFVPTGHYT